MADKNVEEPTPAQIKEQARRQREAAKRTLEQQGDLEGAAALHDSEPTTREHVGKVAGETDRTKPPVVVGDKKVNAAKAAAAADEVPGEQDEDKGPTKGEGKTASGPGTKTAARKRAGKKVASGKKAGKAT